MIRLFKTHNIRSQVELDCLWDFNIIDNNNELPQKFEYKLPVPGYWEMYPQFLTHSGKAAYKRSIIIDEKSSPSLEFKGVSHTADVYFDGKHIGYHYNAYTPFSIIMRMRKKENMK